MTLHNYVVDCMHAYYKLSLDLVLYIASESPSNKILY